MKIYRLMLLLFIIFNFSQIWSQTTVIDMDDAIRIGLTNDYLLSTYGQQKEIVNKIIKEYWRDYLPTLSIQYQGSKNISLSDRDTQHHQIRLIAEQVIYDGGKRGLNLDIAKIKEKKLGEDYTLNYNSLLQKIQTTYLKVIAAKGKIRLHNNSLKRANMQLKLAKREYDLGFITRLDFMEVAAKVEEIKLTYIKSQNEYLQNLDQLKILIGFDHDKPLKILGNIYYDFELSIPKQPLYNLIRHGLQYRNEMVNANTELFLRQKELELSRVYWIPTLSVSAYEGRSSEYLPVKDRFWGVDVKLTMAFGDSTINGGAGMSRPKTNTVEEQHADGSIKVIDNMTPSRIIMENEMAYATAKEEKEKLKEKIALEIIASYNNLFESWELIRITTNKVYFHNESLRIIKTKYDVGSAKRFDIVEKEVDLVIAQEELTDMLARYLINSYDLERKSALNTNSINTFKPGNQNNKSVISRLLKLKQWQRKNTDINKHLENIDDVELDIEEFLMKDVILDMEE